MMTLTEDELDRLEGLAGAGSTEALTVIVASLREARKALASAAAEKEAAVLAEREACAKWHDDEAERLTARRERSKDEWAANGYDATIVNSIRQHRHAAAAIRSRTHSGETK